MNETRTRIWIAVFVGLVFVSGLAVGHTTSTWLRDTDGLRGFRDLPQGRFESSRPIHGRLAEQLEQDPEFTDERRQQLEELLASRRARFRALNEEMRARFEEEQANLRSEMQAILTPAQMEIVDDAAREGRPGRRDDGRTPDR